MSSSFENSYNVNFRYKNFQHTLENFIKFLCYLSLEEKFINKKEEEIKMIGNFKNIILVIGGILTNCLEKKNMGSNNFTKKYNKSAVPEYIWYISLIIIAITLVFTVMSLVSKTNRESVKSIPQIKDVSFSIVVTPLNELKLINLQVLGIEREKLEDFYFFCEGVYFRLGNEINTSMYFSKDINNYFTLIKEININTTKYSFPDSCKEENAKWLLFYGEPGNGGVKLTESFVQYRSFK